MQDDNMNNEQNIENLEVLSPLSKRELYALWVLIQTTTQLAACTERSFKHVFFSVPNMSGSWSRLIWPASTS